MGYQINRWRVTMNELIDNVKQWGKNRMITLNGSSISQAIKTLEETTELLDAVNTKNKPMIKDAIGDVIVTLVMVAEIEGVDIQECLQLAYDEIKDRKGWLRADGTFIKEK